MLKGALLGAGHVALHGHLPGWREVEEARIVAAADPRPDGRAVLAEHAPGLRFYASAEELLLREELDFVDVCTPPDRHAAG